MAKIEVKVPDIGDFKDVPIIEILVKPGDAVTLEQPLLTLESDKATLDVPAPAAGVVAEIIAKIGDKVSMGSALLTLEEAAGATPATAAAPAATPPAAAAASSAAAPSPTPETKTAAAEQSPALADFSGVNAGPSARRLARELDVDLTNVRGSGEKGRITVDDVKTAFRGAAPSGGGGALPEVPTVDFAKFGPVETVALSRIKRISGPRLHASWVNVPHVTHCDEADVTALDAFRKTLDDEAKADKKAPYRVSLLPLLMKASVAVLKAFPTFNAALTPAKDALVYRRYWHIGVAVDTPDGLVVPVIRDVDRKGIAELSQEMGAISKKARDGKLSPTDMQGASFTISSLGGIGGTSFTPIVNAPEVAILGVVRAKMAPVWDGAEFKPRMMLPLSLSYDHRVIDGALGARFARQLCHVLEDVRRLIL